MAITHQLNISIISILIVLMGLMLVAKSDPNTSVNSLVCNENSYSQDDPYANSVAYVLADLMAVTPTQQGYDYSTFSPYAEAVCYGHATCNIGLSNSDCANCLVSAKATVTGGCPNSVGATVELVDCTMRYENYSFL